MSLVEVQTTYGTPALVRLLLGVAGFLLVLLLRLPLVLATRVLDSAARRMDALAAPPLPPIRHTTPPPPPAGAV